MPTIYADYNGSAPICDDVKDYLLKRIENGPFANPNSIHHLGTQTLLAMENARSICAEILGAKHHQLIFNSGATEGISTIFHSVLSQAQNRKIIITSQMEHSATIKTAKHYEPQGFEVKFLPSLEVGVYDIKVLEQWLNEFGEDIALVALMAANNETGCIQPFEEASKLCNQFKVPFLCDTTQYIGKCPFDFKKSNIDYAIMSGHKIGSLIGAGIMLAKDPTTVQPLIIGGGQERNYRSGTQNYIGNECLAVALNYTKNNFHKLDSIRNKREEFEAKLIREFPKLIILGKESPRLASTSYISYPGIHGQAVQIELESKNIFVTTSSACSDNEPHTSRVLKSMGIPDEIGRGVVRISLGTCSPPEFYDIIFQALTDAYKKLLKISNF